VLTGADGPLTATSPVQSGHARWSACRGSSTRTGHAKPLSGLPRDRTRRNRRCGHQFPRRDAARWWAPGRYADTGEVRSRNPSSCPSSSCWATWP